ncbi:MAG: hypothetical protein LBP75_04690 [Planctomycetota bacterium]|nr:hypothetical protein [Planctomycetota bacterium]
MRVRFFLPVAAKRQSITAQPKGKSALSIFRRAGLMAHQFSPRPARAVEIFALPFQGVIFLPFANPARREKSITLIFRCGLGCYALPLRGDGRRK